jgi:ATP-binding cassette subfamily F protein 3
MIAVHIDNVAYTYIHDPILSGLSWDIHDDRVAGLVGPNGAGKSTLLRLIAGELTTESGYLTRKPGLTVGYLPQEVPLDPGATVWDQVAGALTALSRVEKELNRVETVLADPAVYGDEGRLARALAQQERLLDEFVRLGGPGYDGHIRTILTDLGFDQADFSLEVGALSGGQRKLVGLARLLVTQPDLLLLDEPDNHLDLTGKAFLERLVRNYRGAVVIISHDRYLLDLVVDEIVDLEDGRLTRYPGNYSEFVYEKQAALLRQQQAFEAQLKQITRLEESAKRLMLWGRIYDNEKFSQRGKSMLKRIEKIDRIDRPTLERKRMGLSLEGWRGSDKVLEIEGLSKSFDTIPLLVGLDLLVRRGERVGLVGPNGTGKSVLFRHILGELAPDSGELKLGPSVRTGYYAQRHETLDPERTLIDTIAYTANWPENRAVALLGRFLFTYEQARGRVKNLSGGERSRLQMALMMISGANFLLLDEPTNNLDIASAEVLEEVLDDFDGTVLVISHDRYFLDRTVNRIVALEDGRLEEYLGNYSDYEGAKRKVVF